MTEDEELNIDDCRFVVSHENTRKRLYKPSIFTSIGYKIYPEFN